jgi:hypothetical protein
MYPAEKPLRAEAIRDHADEIVDEFPNDDLETLAMLIEKAADAYEEGAHTARAIAAELRRRSAAGVRKWPGSNGYSLS